MAKSIRDRIEKLEREPGAMPSLGAAYMVSRVQQTLLRVAQGVESAQCAAAHELLKIQPHHDTKLADISSPALDLLEQLVSEEILRVQTTALTKTISG